MKKVLILAIPMLLILASFQSSFASSPYITYEVTQIQNDGIVVRDANGRLSLIKKDPGGLKVGDLVRYDSVRDRLRKSPWQLAKIIKMTDSTVTLEVSSGEKIDVRMRSRYRNELKEGDQVQYNAARGQITKSGIQQLNEE
jgi:ASC-1-like (ASCH) protein